MDGFLCNGLALRFMSLLINLIITPPLATLFTLQHEVIHPVQTDEPIRQIIVRRPCGLASILKIQYVAKEG
jgi:hypothetical protein